MNRHAALFNRISRHNTGAARIGNDGHTIALGQRLHRERSRIVEHGFKVFRANDAGTVEGRTVSHVGTGQAARVR